MSRVMPAWFLFHAWRICIGELRTAAKVSGQGWWAQWAACGRCLAMVRRCESPPGSRAIGGQLRHGSHPQPPEWLPCSTQGGKREQPMPAVSSVLCLHCCVFPAFCADPGASRGSIKLGREEEEERWKSPHSSFLRGSGRGTSPWTGRFQLDSTSLLK